MMPDTNVVLGVLEQLPAGVDVWAAAAHLLSPTDVVVGRDLTVCEGLVRFGGDQVYVGGRGVELGVLLLVEFFEGLLLGDEEFLDVKLDEPGSWVKAHPSGAYVHLYGVQCLFGGRHLMVESDVPALVVVEVLRLVFEGRFVQEGTLWVHGCGVRVRHQADVVRLELVSAFSGSGELLER